MNTIYNKAKKKIKDLRKEAYVLEEVLSEPRLNDWLEGVVIDLKRLLPSWNITDLDPTMSTIGDDVHIDITYYSDTVSYEDILDKSDTTMSYSGDAINYEFKETLLFSNIKAKANFTAKLPAEDIEFLKLMNKIVTDTQTTTHAMC